MNIKLHTLKLRNFKGINNFEVFLDGKNTVISGDNAAGKTTIFDAFCWILFNKDSANKTDFGIKTVDKQGAPIHHLEHEVIASLEVEGQFIELKKVYVEKWTKQRGSITETLTGHTTNYFIDAVPVKKGEYEDKIASFVDENLFQLLTSPLFFNEKLSWQKRREILLEICGDVSIDDVISKDETLLDFKEVIGNYLIDDKKKMITSSMSNINKRIKEIPGRINENQLQSPDLEDLDKENLMKQITAKNRLISEKQEEVVQLRNGVAIAEKEKELIVIDGELLQIKQQSESNQSANNQPLQLELSNAIKAKNEVQNALFKIENETNYVENMLQRLELTLASSNGNRNEIENERKRFLSEYHELNALVFTLNQTHCTSCGQSLPDDKIEEARAKFNLDKSNKLEQIIEIGKSKADELEKVETESNKLRTDISEHKSEIERLNTSKIDVEKRLDEATLLISKVENKIKNATSAPVDYTKTPGYEIGLKRKTLIHEEINKMRENVEGEVSNIKNAIGILTSELDSLNKQLADIRLSESIQTRISELENEEKSLAAEYSDLERQLFMIESFIKTKVSMFEEKINNQFELAEFKLFNVQVNGGIDECCETMVNGVPFSSGLNTASRLNVGLDIINTLSAYYGAFAPIFVDNAESINNLIDTESQLVALTVSKNKKLKVEVSE